MGLGKDYAGQNCSLARALEIVGERWTLLIVRDALYGVRRFGDFQAHLDIPKAVLSDRLETLVRHGVLARHRYSDAPPRDEYVITEVGAELWPALFVLSAWSTRRLDGECRRVFTHADCGGTLIGVGQCDRCGVVVPVADVVSAPGPSTLPRGTDRVSVALNAPRRLLEPLFEPTPVA